MLPVGVSACQFWCLCVREQQGYREKTDGLNSPSGFVLTLSPDIFFFFLRMYIWVRCAANPLQYLYLLELKKYPYMDVGGAYMQGWLH